MLQLLRVLRLDLRVEEVADDLLADRGAQLLEHDVPLARVLDERVLLGHGPQVHALAEVVHVVEVLAPAGVDDLEDDEPLELAHQLGAELLFLGRVALPCFLGEVLYQRLARQRPEVFAQLVDRDGFLGRLYVEGIHRLDEAFEVPLLRVLHLAELRDDPRDHLVDPGAYLLGQVLAFEDAPALVVDDRALLVEDVVVLEDVLPRDEVLLLDLLLRVLDLAREDAGLHRLVVRHLEALHDVVDPVAGEEADEIVLSGQIKARLAGVALAARAAAQLVVDPPRLVPLGAEHVEAAELADTLAQLDVDAAAGHVGRDRDRVRLAGIDDDLALTLVLLRVEDVVRDPAPLEKLREVLRLLDRDRADEHRLPLLVALDDVVDDRVELGFLGLEDVVVLVSAGDRDVGRDLDDAEVVDLDELLLLGLGRTGHAGELLVEAEVVLQGDGREGDVLLLDRDSLLGFDRLVKALAPAAAFHDPAGELVDDLHFAVLDDVLVVAVVERLRLHRLDHVVDELRVTRVVEVLEAERPLELRDALLRGRDDLVLLVVLVVRALRLALAERVVGNGVERLRDAGEVVVDLRRGLRLAGDDQRRPRLVDEDRVDLVDDAVVVPALDDAVERDGHVVAQVVEPELGVRAVGDIGVVRLFPLGERHHVLDPAGPHPELLVDRPHPVRVALRQVVVDRDQVNAVAGDRIQVQRLRRDERLSFARLHLGDVAFMQDDPTHHLHVEQTNPDRPLERLAHGRIRLEEHLLERLAVLVPLLELGRLGSELLVAQLLEIGLEGRDVLGLGLEALEAPPLAHPQDFFEAADILCHETSG